MKILLLVAGGAVAVLIIFAVIGFVVGPSPPKALLGAGDRPLPDGAAHAKPSHSGGFDLYGLARVPLPKPFKFHGLDTYNGQLSPAEQLALHDDPRSLIFQFAAYASNDWGGHARDPLLLNVVLMNRVDPPRTPERGFSIGRYFSPTGSTIELEDPRWSEQPEGTVGGALRVWRWLALEDHFGADHAPRWAVSVYEPDRAVRLDLFVWRKKMSLAQARRMLSRVLDGLVVHPARDAHFQREGTREARVEAMREARITTFFDALASLGVARPSPGAITFGPDAAGWLDVDHRSMRALRVLAQLPLPDGVARDRHGRPLLPLSLKPGQYPGATINGLPDVTLGIMYWHAESAAWRRTQLMQPTMNEDWPLQPFEAQVVARLPDRGSVYFVHQTHVYRPPVLEDAAGIHEFMAYAERWRAELLSGRVVALPTQPARLNAPSR
jgi:hypothetical protein